MPTSPPTASDRPTRTKGGPTVRISLGRSIVEGLPSVPASSATGATVGDALRETIRRSPGLSERLLDTGGRLRRGFALFLNGVDVRNLDGEATELREGDLIALIPALPGG